MKLLSLALVLISISSTAQIKNFSVSLSPNYSLINGSSQASSSGILVPENSGYYVLTQRYTVKERYDGKMGATLCGSTDIGISRKLFVTSGVSLSYLRFKRDVKIETAGLSSTPSTYNPIRFVNEGTSYGNAYNNNSYALSAQFPPAKRQGESTALYIEMPVLIGTTFFAGKVDVRVGVIGAYLYQATEYRTRMVLDPNYFQYVVEWGFVSESPNSRIEDYKEKNPENFATTQTGALAEVSCKLVKSISINVSARRYFNSIYRKIDSNESDARYTLLSVGARYTFSIDPRN